MKNIKQKKIKNRKNIKQKNIKNMRNIVKKEEMEQRLLIQNGIIKKSANLQEKFAVKIK